MHTIDPVAPTVLLMFPEPWLSRGRVEWEPLSAAAAGAGFNAVVSHWDAIAVGGRAVSAKECYLRRPGAEDIAVASDVEFAPGVVLTTWGVDWGNRELFQQIVAASNSYHSEVPLLGWFDGKCELEECFRSYEERTGHSIARPATLLSDEIPSNGTSWDDELVIVKPSRGGQCKGIEIVPRPAIASLAREAAGGARPPFVVQKLIDDVFLYEGRRWDLRVHAMATSFSPLRYRLYREGVAKPAAAVATPGSGQLDQWLNADSYLPDDEPPGNLSLTEMLRYIEREYAPLPDFWERIDELVGHIFASIALYAEGKGLALGRRFVFPGFDLIVERSPDRGFELRLLELNSHPGMGWEPHISAAMGPQYRRWFRDLMVLSGADGATV